VELTAKKEKLEKEKARLLANIREETKDLQVDKEKLETRLGHLKKAVDATKSAVRILLLLCCVSSSAQFSVRSGRLRAKNLSKSRRERKK
jgi:hypothetical protein